MQSGGTVCIAEAHGVRRFPHSLHTTPIKKNILYLVTMGFARKLNLRHLSLISMVILSLVRT